MKKIILFILGLIFTLNVNAKTYYSDYGEYEPINELVEQSDIIKLKIEDKYLIYKENKIEDFYPVYTATEDMIKTDETKIVISDWLDEKPEELEGRNIIEQQFYEYQNMKKIRYIKLTDFINSKTNLDFVELTILNKTKELDYIIESDLEDTNKIKDNDLIDYITLDKSDEIIIDLTENVDINDLMMVYQFHVDENVNIYFTMSLYGEEFENIYAKRTIYSPVTIYQSNYPSYLISQAHFELENPLYEEKNLSETKITQNKFNIVNLVTKYKTEDLYIKYQKTEREYLNEYYSEPIEGYILDLESVKEFYYIKKRDKVEIKDNLIIDSYDTKLEDLIISSTISNIKITSNMNYYINGTYDINFILPFKTIKDKLIVDIKDNYIKTLETQNKYLKELEDANENLIISNNKLNTQIKEILENKDETVNEVNNQIIECEYELEQLKENRVEIEHTSKKNYEILFVIPIVLGLILIVIKKFK